MIQYPPMDPITIPSVPIAQTSTPKPGFDIIRSNLELLLLNRRDGFYVLVDWQLLLVQETLLLRVIVLLG